MVTDIQCIEQVMQLHEMSSEQQNIFLKVLIASFGNENPAAVKQYIIDELHPTPKTAMVVSEALDEMKLLSRLL